MFGVDLAAADRLEAAAEAAHQAQVQLIDRLIADRADLTQLTGLSPMVWLTGHTRLPRRQRTELLVVADTLPGLPLLRQRFRTGLVSWPTVAIVCARAGRLSPDERSIVDDVMASAVDELHDADADHVVDVLHELVDQLRTDRHRARERRAERAEFVSMTPFPDADGGTVYAELGAVNYAIVAEAIDAVRPQVGLQRNTVVDPEVSADNRRTLARARAEGLVRLAHGIAPHLDNKTTTATLNRRPLVIATASVETLLGLSRASASLVTTLIGGRLRTTALTARRLADHGCDLRVVVTDERGATVGVGTRTAVPPGWLRDANLAFHATCTAPGCKLPSRSCDLDHADEVRDRGPTEAGNLHPVSRAHHTDKTAGRWTVHIADDQSVTWTHGLTGMAITQPTLPRLLALADPTGRRDKRRRRRRTAA